MNIRRRLCLLASFALASCGGGGHAIPPTLPGAAGSPASTTIALGATARSAPLPSIAGVSGTVTLSAADAPAGTTLLVSAQSGQPAAVALSEHAVRPLVEGTLSVYAAYTFVASSTVRFTSSPGFTLTLPQDLAALDQDLFIGITQPGPAGALASLRTEGPATIDGHTITIDADQNPLTFTAGTSYLFTVYGVSHAPRSYAYVVDNGGTSIKAFPVTANGNVPPTRTLGGASTGLTAITDIATDTQGALYVANYGTVAGGGGSIRVFAHGAHGNVPAVRVLAGPHTQIVNAQAVAVDGDGRLYVGEREPGGSGTAVFAVGKLLRFAPGATGDATPEASLDQPSIQHIALDSTGKNLIESNAFTGPSYVDEDIRTYPRAFSGSSPPLFEVIGTGGQPIAEDRPTHSYYVLGTPPLTGDILRWDEAATGGFGPEATPPATLDDLVPGCGVRALAVDPLRELVTTGSAGTGCSQPAIDVYDPDANGAPAPLRTIAGPATTLTAPASVAIGF